MKKILIISAVLAIIALATFGCLYIFGFMGFDAAMTNLLKVVATIVLLGGCSALVALLMGGDK